MSSITRQAKTLLVIVATSQKLSPTARSLISDELQEIVNVSGLHPTRRRRLLAALHVSRSLETALKEVTNHHSLSILPHNRNMGGYLSALASVSLIPQQMRSDCSNRVRVLRNKIAHGAGEYPAGEQQLNSAANAAHGCISLIL